MSRIINSPMPWKYQIPLKPVNDDDIYVAWEILSKEEYRQMLEQLKRQIEAEAPNAK